MQAKEVKVRVGIASMIKSVCFVISLVGLVLRPLAASEIIRTPTQIEALSEISAYLNMIDTLQARFIQIASDGSVAEGTFYLDRPGRARFDYDHAPLTIIADGLWLAIWDRDLDHVNRLPLWNSPFSILLEEKTDLAQPHDRLGVENVARSQGAILATLFDKENPDEGTISLLFEEEPMILRRFQTVDSAGEKTTVSLSNIEIGIPMDDELFDTPIVL